MTIFQDTWLDKVGKLPTVPYTEGLLSKYLPSGQKFHHPRYPMLQVPAYSAQVEGRQGLSLVWLIIPGIRDGRRQGAGQGSPAPVKLNLKF